jgi:hypothetical protein
VLFRLGVIFVLNLVWAPALDSWAGSQPPANRIRFEEARKTALLACPGKVHGSGLEERDGRWVYTLEIWDDPAKKHEAVVDAESGELVTPLKCPAGGHVRALDSPQKRK